MSFNNHLFSSARGDWETPEELFRELDKEFHFTVDVCANSTNTKVEHYYEGREGLNRRWRGVCWMNPPYGSEIVAWVEKAYQEAQGGSTVVALLPSRTDTRWWHNYVMKAKEIRFIKGRLKFGGATNGAPFPSCVVVF